MSRMHSSTRAGLSPGDYSIATLGSTPRRAEALMEGRCSVTVLNAGNELRAQTAGCSCIASVTELGPYLGTVLATNATDGDMQAHVRRFADILLNVANEISVASARATSSKRPSNCSASLRTRHVTTIDASRVPRQVSSATAP